MRGRIEAALCAVILGGLAVACSGGPQAAIDCPGSEALSEPSPEGWVDIWFCSGDAALAGSLYEPGGGATAAVVFVHGSGEQPRIEVDNPVVTALVEGGVAVLSYDKRGVGGSEGECCPGDDGRFADLIADAEAAVAALQAISTSSGLPVGFYGESQASWIAPAASRRATVDFLVMSSAPPISFGEEILHEQLTEDGIEQAAITRRLAQEAPSGADPRPDIAQLSIPMLWVFGADDSVIPVEYSVDELTDLASAHGLDVTIEVLDGAGHSLIHHPSMFPLVLAWIRDNVGR